MMYRRSRLALVVLFVMTAGLGSVAAAQDYRFAVPEMRMAVHVRPDASVEIQYRIVFQNQPGAHPIDIVDIGLPHADYDISNMTASAGGEPLTEIYNSQYVKPGVEVHLGNKTIPPGATGELQFSCIMPDMVWQDTTNKDLASLQITPTWFGSEYVTGQGSVGVAVFMLEGIKPDEVLYQNEAFTEKAVFQDRAVAIWQWPGPPAGAHKVGVSFPKRGMTRVVAMTRFKLLVKWFAEHEGVRIFWGIVGGILFIVLFFRFTGGTGGCVWLLIMGVLIVLFTGSPTVGLFAPVVFVPLVVLNERKLRRRRNKYLPPIAEVAGGGIKRGLTVPEAAVVLELPLNRVLTLVMFGLLQKGLVTVARADPLRLVVQPEFALDKQANNRKLERLRAAQQRGIVLRAYEGPFLDLLQERGNVDLKDLDFSKPMESLIKGTARRLKGFELEATRQYYRSIVDRALGKAPKLGIPEREAFLDKYYSWILLSDDPKPALEDSYFQYRPLWVRTVGQGGVSTGPSVSGPAPGGTTSLGEVAASFAGWAENTMGSLAGSISPGGLSLPRAKGGVIDLSGMDKVTSDVFKALGSSKGGGGGGGCACACAGCACACACAGGGR